MNSNKMKKVFICVAFVLAYIILLAPYLTTIFYSFPAEDDFSMAATLSSSSLFLSAIDRATYLYMNFGGGIWIAKFFEVLLSPLVSYRIGGIAHGMTMIVFFLFLLCAENLFWRNLFRYEFGVEKREYLEILVLICTAIPLVGFCYPEVFYWFSGAPYGWFLALTLITFSCIIRHFHLETKKYGVLLCILGMISCMNIPYTVPVVLFYLGMFLKHKRKCMNVKQFVPFVFFFCGALVYLLSPGVHARQEYIGSENSLISLFNAGIVALRGGLTRVHSMLVNCPCSFAFLFVVLLLGIYKRASIKKTILSVFVPMLVGLLITMGALYPVMLGYGTYIMPNRICFVFDYLLWGTLIITAYSMGQFLSSNYCFEWDKSKWIMVAIICLFVLYNSLIISGVYKETGWAKNAMNISEVKKEHDEWIDIFLAIESSEEENVIIKHQRIDATGILKDPEVGEDKNWWVNAAAARFFEKESIEIDWQDE